ncbi:MAG: methylglutamate dehydrogenase [Planctomycetes bacterium]|nr:methylglutamate dehydrogenase [Planctomycetota bacterium]
MLRDVTARPRFGCKGPLAEAWLHELGLFVPQASNSWSCERGDILLARLATSEFLVESLAPEHAQIRNIAASLLDPAQRRPGLVPVPRQDLVLELAGAGADGLLLETCNVNFAPLALNAGACAGPVVLTQMVGVGLTVIPRRADGEVSYLIWCDPSFGHYLRSTLAGIADDMIRSASS